MIVIPSIDIKDGKCVRLKQGDFEQMFVYGIKPQDIAKTYSQKGVKTIHIVDLDGAKNGKICQFDTIKLIRDNFEGIIQIGGGIKNNEDIDKLLELKINRIVLGSIAVKDIKKTQEFFKKYGNEIIMLALDFKLINNIPYLAISGWQETSNKTIDVLLAEYPTLKYLLSTDISKDGMQIGFNADFYKILAKKYPKLNIQVSGGVSSLEDINKIKELNIYGAVIGKALFESKISLDDII
jgi:phosphoribosylformimino-5-aminoimidazole carboxamide ribotide isomerase